ncbi:MAG TPA: RNA polymerase sigma factor [Bryobacteraceae bacterium]|nr:RNA polymerase sigma factor [Bryobacteraceae bacterium]
MDLYLAADGGMATVTKAAALAGEPEVLRWFDELHDPLRRYLLLAGAGAADSDDAVQETFLRLHQHLVKGGDRSNVCGWVFQVARNYLRDERKSARRQRTVRLEEAVTGEGGPADPRSSPEHGVLDQERVQRLRAAICSLPEQQRECMLLRTSGLRYREIAAVLGIQISSVGSLVHRAVARLSEELS